MLSGKSLADYRRQIAAEKKRLKMQADEIKPRIDQTDKMKPEAEDWNSLEEMLTDKKKELTGEEKTIKAYFEEIINVQ